MLLQGVSVSLRPLEREDLTERIKMVNDPEVQRFTIGMPADENTEFDILSWYQMVSEDPYSEQWAIVCNGRYIGDIDLHSIGVMGDEAWMSPMFGDPNTRENSDVQREAFRLIAEYAFQEKGVAALRIDIPDVDQVGIRALEELGFELEEAFEFDMFTGAQTLTYSVTPSTLRTER